jgi:epoxyqueuosine reductase
MADMGLTQHIKEMALKEWDRVGITPASRLEGAPEGRRPSDILPTARSVVVGLIHVLDSVCDDLPYSRYEYTNQFFVLNSILNSRAMRISRLLEEAGYRALPIPAAYPRINKLPAGVLSHRHAAVAAGLGEFALNNLLTTEKYGSRVRLVTIVTEADLVTDEPCKTTLCLERQSSCGLACVRSCPTNSISPDGVIDKLRCLHYQEQIMPWSAAELRCGMCVASCPIGKREFREPAHPERRSASVKESKDLWTGAKW